MGVSAVVVPVAGGGVAVMGVGAVVVGGGGVAVTGVGAVVVPVAGGGVAVTGVRAVVVAAVIVVEAAFPSPNQKSSRVPVSSGQPFVLSIVP